MIKRKWMILILAALIVPNLAFSGLKCLYVSTLSGSAPYISDPIVNKMIEWEYEITYISTSECELLVAEDYTTYDFIFIENRLFNKGSNFPCLPSDIAFHYFLVFFNSPVSDGHFCHNLQFS